MKLQIAGGTIRGKDHLMSGKNSHDAYVIRKSPDATVAIVCDGCGSGQHSEVGAKMMAELMAYELEDWIAEDVTEEDFNESLHVVQSLVNTKMRSFANLFDERFNEIVSNYFLFTCFGFMCNKDHAAFFGVGDGYIIVNGEVMKLGPFPNNAPPYLAYNEVMPVSIDHELTKLKVLKFLPLDELDNFLIGTDGLDELVDSENTILPNQSVVGPISQFWENHKFFANNYALSRRLTMMNGGIPKIKVIDDDDELNKVKTQIVMGNGILRDDTTLVAGRILRKKEEQDD